MTSRLFLLTFNRRSRAVTVDELPPDDAAQMLVDAEAAARSDPDVQVVLLSAADEADLRRTHARYFETVDELLETAGSAG